MVVPVSTCIAAEFEKLNGCVTLGAIAVTHTVKSVSSDYKYEREIHRLHTNGSFN